MLEKRDETRGGRREGTFRVKEKVKKGGGGRDGGEEMRR